MSSHEHKPGALIRAQVAYANSPLALASAREIIATKIINSQRLLSRYHHPVLSERINRFPALLSRVHGADHKIRLFNIEALAAREYWQLFSLLSHQGPEWRRVHPHATDSLNILLNTGYVLLARKCLKAIIDANLLPEIGLLHSDNSRDPLVYDLMEIFRQMTVDSVILPIFSRRSVSKVEKNDQAFRKIIALLNTRYQSYFWYERRCERLENIIKLEAIKLRQAILGNKTWKPYQHQWSRHHICKQ